MKYKWIISACSLLLGCLLLLACTNGNTALSAESDAAESADPAASADVPESGLTFGEPSEGMPELPQGDHGNGQPPQGEPPQGDHGGHGNGQPPQGGHGGHGGHGNGQPPQDGHGGSAADVSYTAANEITAAETQSGKTYASAAANENALLIATNEAVTLENPTVQKTGDSDGGDACNFYGLNA